MAFQIAPEKTARFSVLGAVPQHVSRPPGKSVPPPSTESQDHHGAQHVSSTTGGRSSDLAHQPQPPRRPRHGMDPARVVETPRFTVFEGLCASPGQGQAQSPLRRRGGARGGKQGQGDGEANEPTAAGRQTSKEDREPDGKPRKKNKWKARRIQRHKELVQERQVKRECEEKAHWASFEEDLKSRLRAWKLGEAVASSGALQLPPRQAGPDGVIPSAEIPGEVFDLGKPEIAFPALLNKRDREIVHFVCLGLGLLHASIGEGSARHVMVSKTGEFAGHTPSRRSHGVWFKEGVVTPRVERFALSPGNKDKVARVSAALNAFRAETATPAGPGLARWLGVGPTPLPGPGAGAGTGADTGGATGPLGPGLEEARAALDAWPTVPEMAWELVDTPSKVESLAADLRGRGAFAFDLEAHSTRTYYGITCLVQISTGERSYVVDPLAEGVWAAMALLRPVFADPAVVKVGHGMGGCDVPSLYRDFGICIVNAFDTQEAALALGERACGLTAVLNTCGVAEASSMAALKETYQVFDWRQRPLNEEALLYARYDAHYLLPVRDLLRARLLAADIIPPPAVVDGGAEEEEEEAARGGAGGREKCPASPSIRQGLDGGVAGKLASGDEKARGSNGAAGARGAGLQKPGPPLAEAGAQAQPAVASAAWDGLGGGMGKAALVPPPLGGGVEDTWSSDWDSPKQYLDERSRSGSFYRPRLTSIDEGGSGGGGRDGEEVDTVVDDGGGEKEEDEGWLGEACDDENDKSWAGEQQETQDDDEDEHLWEDWGTPAGESIAPDTPGLAGEGGAATGSGPSDLGNQTPWSPPLSPLPLELLENDGVQLLLKALGRTRDCCERLWRPPPPATREAAARSKTARVLLKGMTDLHRCVFEQVYVWRDDVARRLDEGSFFVLKNAELAAVARALPSDTAALRAISHPLSAVLGDAGSPLGHELLGVVRQAQGFPPLPPLSEPAAPEAILEHRGDNPSPVGHTAELPAGGGVGPGGGGGVHPEHGGGKARAGCAGEEDEGEATGSRGRSGAGRGARLSTGTAAVVTSMAAAVTVGLVLVLRGRWRAI